MTDTTKHYSIRVAQGVERLFEDNSVVILERYGFSLSQENELNYTLSGSAGEPELREALGAIDKVDVISLFHKIAAADEDFKQIVIQVRDYNSLGTMLAADDPDFPFNSFVGPCFSKALRPQVNDRFKTLVSELEGVGVTALVGVEFEFCVPKRPLSGYEGNITEYAEGVVTTLNEAVKIPEYRQDFDFADRARTIANEFEARDFIMLYAHESDPLLSEFFEPKFGRSQDGTGYYDNDNVFELSSRPREISQFFDEYPLVQRRLFDTLYKFAFKPREEISQQLSVSFWRDGRNVLLGKTEEDRHITERIVRALGSTFEDADHFILPETRDGCDVDVPVVSPSRYSSIRHAYGRIELKGFYKEAQDLMLGAVLALGACKEALGQDKLAEAPMPKKMYAPTVKTTDNICPWFRHAINGSVVDLETGKIVPDAGYIDFSARKIFAQLFPESEMLKSQHAHDDVMSEGLKLLISKGKIFKDEAGEWQIKWPEGDTLTIGDVEMDVGSLNVHTSLLGVSERYLYPSKRAHYKPLAQNDLARQNAIASRIFGEDLLKALADEYALWHELRDESVFLKELLESINENLATAKPEDHGAFKRFLIPVRARDVDVLRDLVVPVFKFFHTHDKFKDTAYKHVRLFGAAADTETNIATGVFVLVPKTLLKPIVGVFRTQHQSNGGPK